MLVNESEDNNLEKTKNDDLGTIELPAAGSSGTERKGDEETNKWNNIYILSLVKIL